MGKVPFELDQVEDHITRRFMECRAEILNDLAKNESKVSLSIEGTMFLQRAPWDENDTKEDRHFTILEAQFVDENWNLRRVLLDVLQTYGEFTKFDDITKLPGYDKYLRQEPPDVDEMRKKFMRFGIIDAEEENDDLDFMKNRLVGHLLDKTLSVRENFRSKIGIISVFDDYSSKQLQKYNPTSSRVLGDLNIRVEETFQNALYDSTLFPPLQSCIMRIAGFPDIPAMKSVRKHAMDALGADPYLCWKDTIGMLDIVLALKDPLSKIMSPPVDFKMFEEAEKFYAVMEFFTTKLKAVKPNNCGTQLQLFINLRKDVEAIRSISPFGNKLITHLGKIHFDPA